MRYRGRCSDRVADRGAEVKVARMSGCMLGGVERCRVPRAMPRNLRTRLHAGKVSIIMESHEVRELLYGRSAMRTVELNTLGTGAYCLLSEVELATTSWCNMCLDST